MSNNKTNGSTTALNEAAGAPLAEVTPAMDATLRTQNNTPDVYRAISAVTAAIARQGVSKDKKNQQQNFSYRALDDIQNALCPLLGLEGLCILPRMLGRAQEERLTAKQNVMFSVVVEAAFDFVSSRDGSKHTITMFGEAMDSGDKATNKAMSAAYKYACLQVFCIPTKAIEDADATTPEATVPRTAAVASTPAPPAAAEPPLSPAQAVAAEKIANNGASTFPWANLSDMTRDHNVLREICGETLYLDQLQKYGYRNQDELRKAIRSNAPNSREHGKAIWLYMDMQARHTRRQEVA